MKVSIDVEKLLTYVRGQVDSVFCDEVCNQSMGLVIASVLVMF